MVYGAVSEEDGLYIRHVPREEWSLVAILDALSGLGLHAEHVDPTRGDFTERIQLFDVAFLNVHGPYGEDGRIQGLLDYLSVPYTSSGVLASSIGMDKLASKAVFAYLGIPVPRGVPIIRPGAAQIPADFSYPAMLKAVDGGSSVGMALINDPADLAHEIRALRERGFRRLFLEEFIRGRSVTVSAFESAEGLTVLPPLEFITESDYYDESTKLGGSGAPRVEYRVPDDLLPHVFKELSDRTASVYEFLGCRGAVRVDYMIDENGTGYALEVNTIPGLQEHSNLPVSCGFEGITYQELIATLLLDAIESAEPAPWAVR
ncbi:D-alanine--D-alanine ligase [Streptomyces sulfonofaciens]|uniref:D-alanine--D-alanine ligase n=1 Tax=Streptomyces sulfonofaciens TaxID=68272 RepID=A0A919GFK6_9ACTN|nr:D-alanine--D-alanine ligase [Streptomyces sulfonofaciens]